MSLSGRATSKWREQVGEKAARRVHARASDAHNRIFNYAHGEVGMTRNRPAQPGPRLEWHARCTGAAAALDRHGDSDSKILPGSLRIHRDC